MHDVVIIGGGPAGLSAALNGVAEGLSVLLLERDAALGGQAATSSRIENFLGWPNGVNGATLTAKAVKQATRLGAEIKLNHEVVNVEHNVATGFWTTTCVRGTKHVSRTVILASGVDYRRLTAEQDPHGLALYGAPAAAHEECNGHPVVVVGGGNSAGQAALNLAHIGADVTLLVRRPLRMTMSHYLIERIAVHHRVEPIIGEVRELVHDGVFTKGIPPEGQWAIPAHKVFVYIGMVPRTGFIKNCCSIKAPGYVEANADFQANETGLFVAGDVRQGSFKRVAAAVGEGAITAAHAWRYIYDVKD